MIGEAGGVDFNFFLWESGGNDDDEFHNFKNKHKLTKNGNLTL